MNKWKVCCILVLLLLCVFQRSSLYEGLEGDEIDEDGATCRTWADAPEIDGNLFIDEGFHGLSIGDIISVEINEAGKYDLWAKVTS